MVVYRRVLHPTKFRWRPQKIAILDSDLFCSPTFLVGKRLDCLRAAECGWGLIKQDVDRLFATWTPCYTWSLFLKFQDDLHRKKCSKLHGCLLMRVVDRLGWQGTAMIMDEEASFLKRSWCLFELLQTVRWGRIRNWNTERRWEMYGKCLKEF